MQFLCVNEGRARQQAGRIYRLLGLLGQRVFNTVW